jgi:mRNA interferase HicA
VKTASAIKKIAARAKSCGVTWRFVRHGGCHDLWCCGTTTVPIPRHRELGERLAEGIFRDLASELGDDWWR